MKKLRVTLATTIILSSVFLVLLLPHTPHVLAQYSWTDTINIYKDINAVYTDIRKITNNETVTVDVLVYITFTERINLLEYYKLSANGTNFIIISQGNITQSNGTYYGLQQEQTLHFTIEAKGASILTIDDTVKIGVKVELWSAEYVHDIAVTDITLSKTIVGQEYPININVTVQNQGNSTETFNITAYANTTAIETVTNITLTNGNHTTITFTWNTTGWAKGNYTISAYATPVDGETDLEDNNFADGWVFVTIQGDVDGDRDVDIYDVVKITGIYGSKRGDPQFNPNSDLDDDGEIKIYDVVICTSHYRQSWQP